MLLAFADGFAAEEPKKDRYFVPVQNIRAH
jgi:hypothetical protein